MGDGRSAKFRPSPTWEMGERIKFYGRFMGDGRWVDGSRRWEISSYPTWEMGDQLIISHLGDGRFDFSDFLHEVTK